MSEDEWIAWLFKFAQSYNLEFGIKDRHIRLGNILWDLGGRPFDEGIFKQMLHHAVTDQNIFYSATGPLKL